MSKALSTQVLTIGRINCALALEIAVAQRLQYMEDGPYCECGAEIDPRQMDLDKDCDYCNPWAQQAREWSSHWECQRRDRELNPGMVREYDRSGWAHRGW